MKEGLFWKAFSGVIAWYWSLEFGIWKLEFGWSFLRQLTKLNENIPVQFAFLISGCKGC
jgi:hypothetical protein